MTKEDDNFNLIIRPLQSPEPSDGPPHQSPSGSEGTASAPAEQSLRLDHLDDDPAGVRFVDVNQDGLNDLIVFVRFGTPKTSLQTPDGKFEPFTGADKRTSLLKDASLEAFALADINGDGKPEIIVAQDNLARALVVRDGRWTVVDQYSPESADAKITGVAVLPPLTPTPGPSDPSPQRQQGSSASDPSPKRQRGSSPTLVLYDKRAGDLLVFARRDDQTYALSQSMPVGTFELTAMTVLPIGRTGRHAALLADPGKLAVLTPDEKAPTLVEQHAYESETKDAFLADAVAGDLNHDRVRDLAVLDPAKAAVEILTTLPAGDLVRAPPLPGLPGPPLRRRPRYLRRPPRSRPRRRHRRRHRRPDPHRPRPPHRVSGTVGEAAMPADAVANGQGCHLVILRHSSMLSDRIGDVRNAAVECPTLAPNLLNELTRDIRAEGFDESLIWEFIDEYELPGLAFLELPAARTAALQRPPPLTVPIEPTRLGASNPAFDELLGRPGWSARALLHQYSSVWLAALPLLLAIPVRTRSDAILWACLTLGVIAAVVCGQIYGKRFYVLPGGLYIARGQRRRTLYTPRNTLLHVDFADRDWNVSMQVRGRDVGTMWITTTSAYGVRSLLAAWQSPLSPLPVEHWTDGA